MLPTQFTVYATVVLCSGNQLSCVSRTGDSSSSATRAVFSIALEGHSCGGGLSQSGCSLHKTHYIFICIDSWYMYEMIVVNFAQGLRCLLLLCADSLWMHAKHTRTRMPLPLCASNIPPSICRLSSRERIQTRCVTFILCTSVCATLRHKSVHAQTHKFNTNITLSR